MLTFKEIKILVKHKLQYKNIRRANETNMVASALKWQQQLGRTPYQHQFGPHPGIKLTVQQAQQNIEEFYHSGKKFTTIGFGDSILKLTQYSLTSVDPLLNFGLSGSGSPDFAAIAEALLPTLENFGYSQPDAVIVGTFGGNPLLSYQDFEYVRAEAKFAFQKIRSLFPYAKIIVYGIPPVFDDYATHYADEFNKFLLTLVVADGNACYVDLYFRFAGPLSIWPQMKMLPDTDTSSDGIHLTGKAIIEFDRCLRRAVAPGVMLI